MYVWEAERALGEEEGGSCGGGSPYQPRILKRFSFSLVTLQMKRNAEWLLKNDFTLILPVGYELITFSPDGCHCYPPPAVQKPTD